MSAKDFGGGPHGSASAPAVRPLTWPEAPAAGQLAARAFQNDPLFGHILPCPQRRARSLPVFLTGMVRYTRAYGQAWTVADLHGLALVLPPGREFVTWWRALWSGLLFAVLRLDPRTSVRLSDCSGILDRCRTRIVPGPHWYLLLLAVDPPSQGRGLGTALLRTVVDQADRDGRPCYLETFHRANVALYEKHGFAVQGEERLPDGPPFWTMLRPPAGHGPTL